MKISILGMGYVGCVSAACLAKEGHQVIGVDINKNKIEIINSGRSPIIEKGIDEIIKENVSKGRLRATGILREAILDSEISMVCVGTPSNNNGSINLVYVQKVCEEIGEVLREKDDYHLIAIRSTVAPGTMEGVLIPLLEKRSGKKAKEDFGICFFPEFLREGTSIDDYYNPPFIVIGTESHKSIRKLEQIYAGIKAPIFKTPIKVAEMIKYANNNFHALKVSFANEIGIICKELGIDARKVMELFCLDNKLNLSSYYLKPGFAFGGSCLPKDLRAILYEAKQRDLNLPLLDSILKSNQSHIQRGVDMVLETGKKRIGILGFSFKAGTDDLRESPLVTLIETLLGKGFDIMIYDKNISMAKVFGANKAYIEKEIPHISSLMCSSLEELINRSEVIIIGNKTEELQEAICKCDEKQVIIDLVGMIDDTSGVKGEYHGICW